MEYDSRVSFDHILMDLQYNSYADKCHVAEGQLKFDSLHSRLPDSINSFEQELPEQYCPVWIVF